MRLPCCLTRWLLDGIYEADRATQAIEHRICYYQTVAFDEMTIGIVGPAYVSADREELLVEYFHKVSKSHPATPTQATTPAQVAYLLAKNRLEPNFSQDEIRLMLDRFFKRTLMNELTRGQYRSVAHWMKIAFWDNADPQPTPVEALLRCYDYLPYDPPGLPEDQGSTGR